MTESEQSPAGGLPGEPEQRTVIDPGNPPEDGPRDLVARMLAAGKWPPPDLLRHILALGDAAIEPLLEVLETRPRGWPQEAPLHVAAGLLGMLGHPSTLPSLVSLFRAYPGDTGTIALEAIAGFGARGLDLLLELVQDPAVTGLQKVRLSETARAAIGADPERKGRLIEIIRGLFQRTAVEARAAVMFEEELLEKEAKPKHGPRDASDREADHHGEIIEDLDADDLDDLSRPFQSDTRSVSAGEPQEDDLALRRWEEARNELSPEDSLSLLANDLLQLNDDGAVELIRQAVEQELLDPIFLDQSYVTGQPAPIPTSWIEYYEESYRAELAYQERMARTPPVQFPSRTSYPSLPPREDLAQPPRAPGTPFRHDGPKCGRNDPCWCGSGKKYKKCHMGRDGQQS